MRRAPIVLTATIAGTAVVLGFHAHQPSRATLPIVASRSAGATSGRSSARSGSSAPSGSAASPATTTASPAPAAPAKRSHPHVSRPRTEVVTGAAVANPYGYVQVRVAVKGGKITDVQALQLPDSNGRSLQISDTVAPYLRQSALARQSSAIDGVSGATYTSEAYRESLQSALDHVGAQNLRG